MSASVPAPRDMTADAPRACRQRKATKTLMFGARAQPTVILPSISLCRGLEGTNLPAENHHGRLVADPPAAQLGQRGPDDRTEPLKQDEERS